MAVAALLLGIGPANAQTQSYSFSSAQWKSTGPNARVLQHLGRESLYLENQSASVEGVTMEDGTAEVDVSSAGASGFAHLSFRTRGVGESEDVYLRLGGSGSPAAVQYAPIFRGVSAWQLHGGPGSVGQATFDRNAWTHLRVDVSGGTAAVYINEGVKPVLTVDRLRRSERGGGLALWGEFGVYFSNFRFTPRPAGQAAPPEKAAPSDPNRLLRWELSEAFPPDSVQMDRLPVVARWSAANAEPDGLLNFSRFRDKPANTAVVCARATIRSERAQTKKLYFGYSDATRVYLNGRALFEGQSAFRSRDPQFMGMIGWNDAVYLALKPGANELVFVVAESFGGWGVQARLADLDGIAL